jgi:hypothetical protein
MNTNAIKRGALPCAFAAVLLVAAVCTFNASEDTVVHTARRLLNENFNDVRISSCTESVFIHALQVYSLCSLLCTSCNTQCTGAYFRRCRTMAVCCTGVYGHLLSTCCCWRRRRRPYAGMLSDCMLVTLIHTPSVFYNS